MSGDVFGALRVQIPSLVDDVGEFQSSMWCKETARRLWSEVEGQLTAQRLDICLVEWRKGKTSWAYLRKSIL